MGLAEAGIEREPRSGPELVLNKCGDQAAGGILRERRGGRTAAIVLKDMEELIVLLRETVETHPRVVAAFDPRDVRLPASIFRAAGFRCGAGCVERIAAVVGAVVVKEGRHG